MDETLMSVFSVLPTIIFCCVVWGLVVLQRRLLEGWIFVKIRESRKINLAKKDSFYTNVALPMSPIGTAIVFGYLIPAFPLFVIPGMTGMTGRMLVCGFLGMFCGLIYRIAKKTLFNKLGTDLDTSGFDFTAPNVDTSVDSVQVIPATPTQPAAAIVSTTTTITATAPTEPSATTLSESGTVPPDYIPPTSEVTK